MMFAVSFAKINQLVQKLKDTYKQHSDLIRLLSRAEDNIKMDLKKRLRRSGLH
jgi:hypothetical protein